jgi:hypothetical protein
MKSFSNSFESFFDNEVTNLRTLGDSEAQGVVQYLGSFRHADWPVHQHTQPNSPVRSFTETDTMTCHILLEFGKRDLLDFFQESSPPAHHTEIRHFWLDLFRVAKALEEIHELKIKVEETSKTVFAYALSTTSARS